VTRQRDLIFPVRHPRPAPAQHHLGGSLITISPRKDDPIEAGETLAALYFPAPEPNGFVVCYFHGNADQIGYGGAYVGKLLRNEQFGTFAIEYPGYGHASEGVSSPSEAGMYAAADSLIAHLTAPTDAGGLGVPSSSVVLMGQSIGGAVALEMAKNGHGVALLLLSPFSSLSAMVNEKFQLLMPVLRLFPFLLWDHFDNIGKASAGLVGTSTASQHQIPTLVAHGTKDSLVPYSQGLELADALGAEMLPLKNAGHNDVLADQHWQTFVAVVKNLLEREVGRPAEKATCEGEL